MTEWLREAAIALVTNHAPLLGATDRVSRLFAGPKQSGAGQFTLTTPVSRSARGSVTDVLRTRFGYCRASTRGSLLRGPTRGSACACSARRSALCGPRRSTSNYARPTAARAAASFSVAR